MDTRETSAERPDEELESIPWDALLTDDSDSRRRWLVIAGAAIALVAISASAARTLWPSSPAPVAVPTTEAVGAPVSPEPSPTSTVAPPTSSPPSEADLMAAPGDGVEREVVAHAELAVRDYFTLDGTGWEAADLVPGLAPPEGRSFVEEVVATGVVPLDTDRYAVTLVVSTLGAPPDGGYVRLPRRAVEVVMELGPTGPVPVDLPRPLPVSQPRALAPAVTEATPPPAVVDAALAEAGRWGEPDRDGLVAGVDSEGRWRLVVPAVDDVGNAWPVAVWLDEAGRVLPPGG